MAQNATIVQPIVAEADELWKACATPEGLQGWQADSVEGEVRTGARLRLAWPTLGAALEVDVVEVQAPRRLVLTAGSHCTIFDVQPNRLLLTLSGSSTEDEVAGTLSAWRVSLGTLAHWLRYHPGSPRQVHWAACAVTASSALAHAYFTGGPALSTWLTSDGEIGDAGSSASLRLRWGQRLTGQVIAHTPGRDLAVSWQEQNQSVLALRTLPLPADTERRLLALQWSTWDKLDGQAVTASHLDVCVHRLAKVIGQRGLA